MTNQPLVFISCGQYSSAEIELGKSVEALIREETAYEPYFAEQQNTLEGLSENILGSLARCSAFVGIMHHRGNVITPHGSLTRASVWVEQELAIAAFIQKAIGRKVEVAIYMEAGIHREGMRQQLRLKPVEFESAEAVITDLRERIGNWSLAVPVTQSLIAEWKYETLRETQQRHDYRLRVTLRNTGTTMLDDWRAEVHFPTMFLEGVNQSEDYKITEENDSPYSDSFKRFYPGDQKQMFNIAYYVDESNWHDGSDELRPPVLIKLWSGDMEPWEAVIPMSKLERF